MAVTAPQIDTTTPASAPRKGIQHAVEHPYLAAWLAIAEPDAERERLIRTYVSAAERRTATMRREPELLVELKAVARQIAGDPGRKLEDLLRHQARLTAELAVIEDIRVEVTTDYISASRTLGKLLDRQILADHNAAVDAINAYAPERDKLRRIVDTLPKPKNHGEAQARLTAIAVELQPQFNRRDVCQRALSVARPMQIDSADERRMLERARKG